MAWRNSLASLLPFALLVPGVALADVKAGVDAWGRGDSAVAIRDWQPLAERGAADALFNLGQAYKLGRGVKADLAKAEGLFGRAAAKGHLQAADLYGLLLFQRGERARAIPYVTAAAERGDPRAQYLLGVAHFNGDAVPKDWVRAYALTSLAQQAGVPQAKGALAQMDRLIPLEQRQQAAALAPELASRAEATRARQLAAVDLGASAPATAAPRPASRPTARPATRDTAELAARIASTVADDTPRTAGADYARPKVVEAVPASPRMPRQAPVVISDPARGPVPVMQPHHTVGPAWEATKSRMAETMGGWAVQLGAFSQAANADALWGRVRERQELVGTARRDVRAGAVTRLTAAGFRTREDAASACERLTAAKISCIVVRN
jgi:cell division septation protein DedD